MAKIKNMEAEFFHFYVTGKTKSITKTTKGVEKTLERFISADELCYSSNNIENFDQNAFMFALVSTCKNVEELKQKVMKLYNAYREKIEKEALSAGKNVRRHRLESVDEVSLCVSNIHSNGFKMPTYNDDTAEYSVVPEMFRESYEKTSSYGPTSLAGVARNNHDINNPFNLIKFATLRLIEQRDKYSKSKAYNEYTQTLLRNIRAFFEDVLSTKLNGKDNHYESLVQTYVDEYLQEDIDNGNIRVQRLNTKKTAPYVVFYKNAYGRELMQSLSDYLCVELQKPMTHLDEVYEEVLDEEKKIRKYTSIESDVKFLKTIFENEQDILKYGELRGNSIKFYVFLAQFANQIKLQEAKRIIYTNALNNKDETLGYPSDQRRFSSLYSTDEVEFELAARGSVSDIVKLFNDYNSSVSSLGDIESVNADSNDEEIANFDSIIDEHFGQRGKYEPAFERVLAKRNPRNLL